MTVWIFAIASYLYLLLMLLPTMSLGLWQRSSSVTYRRYDYDRLHQAIVTYNEPQAFTMIDQTFNRDVNVQNATGWAPIHVAAFAGSEAFAAFLIDNRADLRIQTKSGLQALHIAIMNNRISFAQMLLQANKELAKEKCCDGKSLSHLAAEYNIADFVYLLRDEFNMTVRDGYGQPPICWAARNGSVEFMTQLFDEPLFAKYIKLDDPICVYDNGTDQILAPLLHIAAHYDHLRFVELLLLRSANASSLDTIGSTAIHAVAERDRPIDSDITTATAVITKLKEWGAEVDARDAVSRTAYLNAIHSSTPTLAAMLVERFKVNTSAVDLLGFTAFHLSQRPETLEYLANCTTPVKYLEEVNRKNKPQCTDEEQCQGGISGLTPLLLAVKMKTSIKYIKYLVEHGANIYATNDLNQTVLHLAVESDHMKAIRYFTAESFTDLTQLCDTAGRTALFYAVELNKTEPVCYLSMSLDYGSPVLNQPVPKMKSFAPMHMAVHTDNTAIIKCLLENGATLTAIASNGRTPLHEAVAFRNIRAVEKIVETSNSSALKVKDRLSRTALHLCVTNIKDDFIIASLLLPNHARCLQEPDMFGDTPLQRAIYHESIEIVRLFLENNASCNILDAQERTPLVLAKQINNEELIEVVSQYCKDDNTTAAGGELYFVEKWDKTCSASPTVSNGQVDNGPSVIGTIRRFFCDIGYVSEGSTTVNCSTFSRWVINGHCRKACPSNFEIEHGFIDTADGSFGVTGTIRCSAGFRVHGHNVAYCTEDGRWEVAGRCQTAIPDYFQPGYYFGWNASAFPQPVFTASSDIQAILTVYDQEHLYEAPSIILVTHQGLITALSRSDWSVVEWRARVSLDGIYLVHAVYDSREDEIYFTHFGDKLSEQIYRASRWSLMTAGNRFGSTVPLQVLIHNHQSEGRRYRGMAIDNDARLLYACDYDGQVGDISVWLLLPSILARNSGAVSRRAKLVGSLKLSYSPMFCSFFAAPRQKLPLLFRRSTKYDGDALLLAIADHRGNQIELIEASYDQVVITARRLKADGDIMHDSSNNNNNTNISNQDTLAKVFRRVAMVSQLDKTNSTKLGSIYCPNEVFFDPLGNLFVADNCNYRFQIFQLDATGNLWAPMRATWAQHPTGVSIFRLNVARNPKTQKLAVLANAGGNRLISFD